MTNTNRERTDTPVSISNKRPEERQHSQTWYRHLTPLMWHKHVADDDDDINDDDSDDENNKRQQQQRRRRFYADSFILLNTVL